MGSIIFIIIVIIFFRSLFRNPSKTSRKTNDIPKSKAEVLQQIMCVVAYLMKSNNIAKKCELEEVKIFLKKYFSEEQGRIALQQLKIYLNSHITEFQINNSCRVINHNFNYESKILIIQLLFKIAAADNLIDAKEINFINYVANYLKIYQHDYDRIARGFNMNNSNYSYNYNYNYNNNNNYSKSSKTIYDNYKILGITPYASEKEIKQAFRAKAKIFHPDKYANKSEAERLKAQEKFQEINNAYEAICKEKNIK